MAAFSLPGLSDVGRAVPLLCTNDVEKALRFVREGEAAQLFDRHHEALLGDGRSDLVLSLFRLAPEAPMTFSDAGTPPAPEGLLLKVLSRRYPCGQRCEDVYWPDPAFAQQFRR